MDYNTRQYAQTHKSQQIIKRKIVLIGNKAIGKSAFINRFINNTYTDDYEETVFDNKRKILNNQNFAKFGLQQKQNYTIDLELWDTSGQHHYDKVRPLAYNNVNIIILSFNLIDKKSFIAIKEKWYPEIKDFVNKCGVKIVLLGLKFDLVKEVPNVQVRAVDINELKKQLNCSYVFCSSKEDFGVENCVKECLDVSLEEDFYTGWFWIDVRLIIWASGLLGFWASGHLGIWASGLLGI